MAQILVHITTGPENPTRAALGFLVARTAQAGGHEVSLFLAGDAVDYLRPETRDAATGVGTGSIAEHWAALVDGGARIYGSGMSSKARAVAAPDGVELCPPDKLVDLIVTADRTVVY